LDDARKEKVLLKDEIRKGSDPAFEQKTKLQEEILKRSLTFEAMALEWHAKQVDAWKEDYAQTVIHRLEKYAFPFFGSYPLSSIKPMHVLRCLQKVEKTAPEMSRRIKAYCCHIFKYAIATGRAETDPTYGLEAALKKFKKGHYASISVDESPKFIVTLHEYQHRVYRQTFLAIKLLLLTFVRTAEMVEAKWPEIDFEKAMWIIPGERMKMGLPHMVPLSRQSLAILDELKQMNGDREYVFASYYGPRKPMYKNTMLVAIKRMGYDGKMTGHSFRSLALGLLKEKLGYSHEFADRQLAHVPKSSIDRAYDRAQYLPQRTEMMQRYADYVDDAYRDSLQKT
jgi:integrase